jgi:hypothetical protein
MSIESTTHSSIVQRLWNYCNVLRSNGISCGETKAGRGIDVKTTICEGRLVLQNPDDEPASALLAWIRAEREARKSKRSRKRKRKTERARQLRFLK